MKVLIADDDALALRLLEASLERWGYDVETASDGDEALRALTGDSRPDLAVIDWMMPKLNGIEVVREVRKMRLEPYIYMILLTAKEGKEALVEAIDAGADDFIFKPFDPSEVRARLRAAQRIVELQAELIHSRALLHRQATFDALTGIWNRRAVRDALQSEVERCRRLRSSLAVMLADVDHFKSVNDQLGHPAGDEVLKCVAWRIKEVLRPYDGVGRYGGEEFLVFAAGCDSETTLGLSERIRQNIAGRPIAHEGRAVAVTTSIGAVVAISPTRTMDELIATADRLLYRAKNEGRNRVVLETLQ